MSTRIIHFSDTHESAVFDSLSGLFDKRIAGFVNSRFMRGKRYDRTHLERAAEFILNSRPDVIVFTGDAVSSGAPAEFERVSDIFITLAESSIPFIYTPGNHDLYVKNKRCRAAFDKFYKSLVKNNPLPYVMETDELRFAVLEEARPTPIYLSCGYLTGKSLSMLEKTASDESSSKPLVAVGHFPLLVNHARRGLRNKSKALELLRAGKIALSLCGHVHKPGAVIDDRGYGEITAGSLTLHDVMAEIVYDNDIFKYNQIKGTSKN